MGDYLQNYDITGKQFGFWTVLYRDKQHPGKQNSYWVCRCKCGCIKSVNRSTLINGRSQSCGCMPSEKRKWINKTHGMSGTRLYREWASMRMRCSSSKYKSADSYFYKGIKVCDEWNSSFEPFRDWALSNGYSDSLTLDRIDNSKGYNPSNCRWVSMAFQQGNRTNTVYVDYEGKKWCLRTLCVFIGFPYKLAHGRYMNAKRSGKELTVDQLLLPPRSSR